MFTWTYYKLNEDGFLEDEFGDVEKSFGKFVDGDAADEYLEKNNIRGSIINDGD